MQGLPPDQCLPDPTGRTPLWRNRPVLAWAFYDWGNSAFSLLVVTVFVPLMLGSIWDVGCYPISFARMIVGAEPVEVFGWQLTGQGGSDESFFGQMRFKDEVHMQFDCGFRSPSRSFIEIVGTDATLNIPDPFKPGRKNEIYLNHNNEMQTIKIKGKSK